MSTPLTYLVFLSAILTVVLIRTAIARRKRWARLPPGPKGLPIVGNVLQMPKSQEWLTFSRWAEQYGDIIYLNILGQPLIILNAAEDAVALLDKGGSIYANRPILAMGGELVGWNRTLALTQYGERFREYRRLIARFIGGKAQMARHLPLVERETRRLLQRILNNPEDLAGNIRKTAGAIILTLSHGYRIREDDDPVVAHVGRALEQFTEASTPGAFLVDVFPILRHVPAWLPGASFKATAKRCQGETLEQMADVPHNYVKEQMASNKEIPNFTSELLRDEKLGDIDSKEFNIKWAAASMYSGGADTTVSSIHSFVLAMVLHPHVQRRAQAEIDAIIGPERLPTFEDRAALPYVEALFKEVLRWNPVGPLGLPHRLSQDDVYKGYLLPKGSIIIANIWSFLRDHDLYPNPSDFDPTRHLPKNNEAASQPDPRTYCFGFGRRVCPGQHLADASVWLACATMLAAFNIEKLVASDGTVIDVEPEYTSGTVSHPKPFKCSIKPRSARANALINAGMPE
uniref:Cytochrome P450 n=1 Tax=Phanerodontia chrysosporium TaxID=2822231 RepID=G5EJL7_PHACH|nr:cytochrome P450 [Phanerodontia chrysosporium]